MHLHPARRERLVVFGGDLRAAYMMTSILLHAVQDVPLGETMSDPKEPQPFDPYQTLQLHPEAPLSLLTEAYWLLVSSARASSSNRSPANGSRIEELNAAYAMLVNESARQSYDQAHGVRPPTVAAPRGRGLRIGWFSAKHPAVDYADYYHLLRIDRDADDQIIQLAYEFWTHGVQSQRAERERIEEAHRTLSNPQLRAQYEARRHDDPPPNKELSTKQEHSQTRHDKIQHERSTRIAAAAAPQERPPSLQKGESRPARSGEGEVPAANSAHPAPVVPEPENGHRIQPAAARIEPAAIAIEADLRGPVVTASAIPMPLQATPEEGPTSRPGGERRGGVSAPKQLAGSQLADAQHNRLLQLRDDVPGIRAVSALPTRALDKQVSAATIAFVAGPRAKERVLLVGDVITLGSAAGCDMILKDDSSNIEPEHARLMRHGATYMFHDLAGHNTAITDGPLPLAVVMLEDGDEIQIGSHRMRFATGEAIEPSPAATGEAR